MSLTVEQIKNVLGTTRTRNTILTATMKDAIDEMIDTEENTSINDITSELQENHEGGERVKKEHVKNYLKRLLKNQEK